MRSAPRVTWRDLTPSDTLRELVDDALAVLVRAHPRLDVADVEVAPHPAGGVDVRVRARAPGREPVEARGPRVGPSDPATAVRDAFRELVTLLEAAGRPRR